MARDDTRDVIPSVLDGLDLPPDLSEFLHRLRTQNHAITAWPIYNVEQKERIFGVDPRWHDVESVWTYDGCDDGPVDKKPSGDEKNVEEIFVVWEWRYVCSHLTMAAAELYIAQNSHNLGEARVFIGSQHRCYEWQEVLRILGQAGG